MVNHRSNAIVELMRTPAAEHDELWLKKALQHAILLELATLPPYLCGLWSIEDEDQGSDAFQIFDLLRALQLPLPADRNSERKANALLTQFLLQGLPVHIMYDHPEPLVASPLPRTRKDVFLHEIFQTVATVRSRSGVVPASSAAWPFTATGLRGTRPGRR
ncbi:ferritin-like domain-containing protein [Streptomyces sp. CA-252508]|uniref:ferritin-like domain-containing protein n=1 Tax=Streptomyces sp. CA-252508 TaxID=3418946 RepID=UPI003D94C63F